MESPKTKSNGHVENKTVSKPIEVYFKANKLWETMLVLTILVYMSMMAFRCDLIVSYSNNGSEFMGSFIEWICNDHHMVIRNTLYILILLHLTQAILAGMLCAHMECQTDIALKWTFNVFFHGILSFRHLLTMLFEYESQNQEPLAPEMKYALQDLAR